MKKYILLIFACIYAIHLNAQNAGINFLHGTTWAEACLLYTSPRPRATR